MAAGASVSDNREEWDRFVRGLNAVNRGPKAVVAGVQEGPQQKGIQVAQYAAINEFGVRRRIVSTGRGSGVRTVRIPSRPFMRLYYDNNFERIARFAENAITQAVLGNATPQQAFTAIGVYNQNGIRDQIKKSSDYVPNAPLTIHLKGSDKPLIYNAILLANISFAMRIR